MASEPVLDDIGRCKVAADTLIHVFRQTGLTNDEACADTYKAVLKVLNTQTPNAVVALAGVLGDLLDSMVEQYEAAKRKRPNILAD